MKNEQQKYLLMGGAAIVLVLVIIIATWKLNTGPAENATVSFPTPTSSETITAPTKPSSNAAQPSGVGKDKETMKAALSYSAALAQYKNKVLQFDNLYGAACAVTPSEVTFPNNTHVMLDNRITHDITISLDGMKYVVKAHDFTIATVSNKTLPHTTLIDCGAQQNIGKILIQR